MTCRFKIHFWGTLLLVSATAFGTGRASSDCFLSPEQLLFLSPFASNSGCQGLDVATHALLHMAAAREVSIVSVREKMLKFAQNYGSSVVESSPLMSADYIDDSFEKLGPGQAAILSSRVIIFYIHKDGAVYTMRLSTLPIDSRSCLVHEFSGMLFEGSAKAAPAVSVEKISDEVDKPACSCEILLPVAKAEGSARVDLVGNVLFQVPAPSIGGGLRISEPYLAYEAFEKKWKLSAAIDLADVETVTEEMVKNWIAKRGSENAPLCFIHSKFRKDLFFDKKALRADFKLLLKNYKSNIGLFLGLAYKNFNAGAV